MSKPVALVTGASRGIGAGIALSLAKSGYTVVGTATSEAGAEGISTALHEHGGTGMVLNVNDAPALELAVKEIEAKFGSIYALVNNAGITRDGLLMRMKDDDWDAVLDTNLKAVYRLSKAVMRGMMKARQGRIINIGSVVGSMGNAGQVNYAAAKAGLIGLTKSLAQEIGSRNITVNCVAPGFIDTDMTRVLPTEQRQELISKIPLARLGEVDDIAQSVVFLASAGAGYITGNTLHVNGGMYMS
ncbi:MAG: beta-ketoacyl-ACP reductase [Pseudomonadota bacterium]|jgi:3-oxoacyl-[acyl-carrier protein] reductase